ncbi:MAG: serine hydrolase [Deltaproteobacteria bacterium]|nr:serine hydrolase [Deltaproteobacteria bacterium]
MPRRFHGPVSADWADRTEGVAEPASEQLAALDAYLFPGDLDEKTREGVRTDGVIIVRDGTILYERYGRDWTGDKPHLLWSASKSFSTTLIGIAVHQGRLDLTDSICDHIEVGDPASCAIRVQDLMDFSSGLAWRETYENESPTASSVLAMLFGQGSRDMSRFVTGHPLRDPPGSTYQYSSGDTNVLTDVARAALEEVHGERYPWTTLFEPLGITSAVWERDGSGLPIGSSYLYLTPRDMARYGAFMLDDGCWGGERLLPAGWWARAARVNDAIAWKAYERGEGDVPGWGLWLNQPVPALDEASPWPAAPTDVYCALGHWRQAICALPSRDLIVVRVGDRGARSARLRHPRRRVPSCSQRPAGRVAARQVRPWPPEARRLLRLKGDVQLRVRKRPRRAGVQGLHQGQPQRGQGEGRPGGEDRSRPGAGHGEDRGTLAR